MKLHNSRCILLRKFGIVCNHYDKAVFCDFFQQLHNLGSGFAVKCTGGFIRK